MNLKQHGNNANEFMMYTLASLIKPDMDTYKNLQSTILDRIMVLVNQRGMGESVK